MSMRNGVFNNLTIAILTIIDEEKANYGYTICNYIEYAGMACTHQQIYRELRKFTESDYLSRRAEPIAGKPDRQIYTITSLGKKLLGSRGFYKGVEHKLFTLIIIQVII